MSAPDNAPDDSRRKFLTRATVSVGLLGVLFATVPSIESWLPSERAGTLGNPVMLDPSKIEPGQMVTVIWRLKPIFIVHRTTQMLALLGNHDADLKDPESLNSDQPLYCRTPIRARRARLFVTIGICTHLGCVPKARFSPGEPPLGPGPPRSSRG